MIEDTLRRAAARLATKGLLKPGDTLSRRVPEQHAFVAAEMSSEEGAPLAVRWRKLADTPTGLHHRIYASRDDVGAIVCGSFKWSSALARLNISLPAVFDEQVRHLGIAAQRLPMSSTKDRPIAALGNGANAYILDDATLCFGMELGRLVANAEILEKCAESFVLAYCASGKVKRIPWLIRFIANSRLKKDQKEAAACHLRGERAIVKASY